MLLRDRVNFLCFGSALDGWRLWDEEEELGDLEEDGLDARLYVEGEAGE